MTESSSITRRGVLRAGAAIAVSAAAGKLAGAEGPVGPPKAADHGDPWRGLKVGITTYTFKQRPLEPTILAIQRVDLHYCSIKDFHLPLKSTAAERKEVADKFKAAGITPLSCGVIKLVNNEEVCRQAFDYARDAGLPTITCAPFPDALPLLDKLVKEYDIRLAIHNHGPEDKVFPSPNEVWAAIEQHDPRIGFCIDVGHCARAGVDPVEAIRKYRERLYDMHFKDIMTLEPKAKAAEVGRGVLDIRGMLQALLEIKYSHVVNFEYEKEMGKDEDPLPGLAEGVGYTRGVLVGV
jgi:sugar phosphate isomerase/epimerase